MLEPPPKAATRPSPRSLVSHIAWTLSLWFGCGRVPRAPGTAGTVGAVPLYLLLRPHGLGAVAVAAAMATGIGIWASSRVARASGLKDPQFVCIDEVAGVLVAWLGAPEGALGTFAGF